MTTFHPTFTLNFKCVDFFLGDHLFQDAIDRFSIQSHKIFHRGLDLGHRLHTTVLMPSM